MANFLNALKRAAGAALFSKFAPSWLLNASSRCRGIHKQQMSGMDEELIKAMFLKGGIGMFVRAEFLPNRNGIKGDETMVKNSDMMKLRWLTRLRDEKMHDRSEKSGINTRSLDYSEDEEGRNFREDDQVVVRFQVEEGDQGKNDERRISGKVHLPRQLHGMDGAEGEIKFEVLKLWLPDDDDIMYRDHRRGDDTAVRNKYGEWYDNIRRRLDVYIYGDSSGDDYQSEDPGDGSVQQPGQTTAQPEEATAQQHGETTAQQPRETTAQPEHGVPRYDEGGWYGHGYGHEDGGGDGGF